MFMKVVLQENTTVIGSNPCQIPGIARNAAFGSVFVLILSLDDCCSWWKDGHTDLPIQTLRLNLLPKCVNVLHLWRDNAANAWPNLLLDSPNPIFHLQLLETKSGFIPMGYQLFCSMLWQRF